MRSLLLVLIIFCLLTPAALMAQDDLTETYATYDGSLTFSYPAGWIAWGYGTQYGYIANSEAAQRAIERNEQVLAGQAIISVAVTPFDTPSEVVTLDEMLANMRKAFEPAALETVKELFGSQGSVELLGEPALIDDLPGGAVETMYVRNSRLNTTEQILNITMIDSDRAMIELNVTAPVGETPQYRDLALAVAATVRYSPPTSGGLVIAGSGPEAQPGSGPIIWKQQRARGASASDFGGLGGMTIGPDDTIYVADGDKGVHVLDASGTLLYTVGNTEIGHIDDVALAPDGTLWVADSYAGRLYHLDPQGNMLLAYGEYGTEPGQFGDLSPTQVEVGADGSVYTVSQHEADYRKWTSIIVLAPDGTFVRDFPTNPDGDFILPGDVQLAVGPGDVLHAADFWTQGVRTFAPDGTVLKSGLGGSVLMAVEDVAAAPDGAFYAVFMGTIYKFDSNGHLLAQAQIGADAGVMGMAVMGDGSLVIAAYLPSQDAAAVMRLRL